MIKWKTLYNQIWRSKVVLVAMFCPLIGLQACSQTMEKVATNDAANLPLPEETQAQLLKAGMRVDAPIFIRVYKKEAELEIWKQKDDGLFYKFKSYPICNYSGKLGPKLKQGDKQAPEGFYRVYPGHMNPNSKFHLSFNLGYPNAYDRAYKRTGANLMVHGDCRSAGCYAMTDALMEEIYAFAREAFKGGQKYIEVHAYPFRMTSKNLLAHRKNRWYEFWRSLKKGSDEFDFTRTPPIVRVCEKKYHVNPVFAKLQYRLNPAGPCPGSPGFRPLRRNPPALTIAGARKTQDPFEQAAVTENDPVDEDPGFNSLSLPDDIFSDDLGGLRGGLR